MILFYILVFVSPMPNHPLFEAPFAGLTVVKWLGIICCGYGLVKVMRSGRAPKFLATWETRSFAALFVIVTISFLTISETANLTFNPMLTYFTYLLLFFTTISLVTTYEQLRKTLLAAIAGAALASLYVIREYQASGGTNMRPGYVAGDSNYFATCTALVIPVALYLAKLKGSKLQRWFCVGSLVLMLVAFTLASSRGGLVGLAVAILYMIVCSGRSRRTVILTVSLLVPLLMYSPASPLARMLHPTYGDTLAADIRQEFWKAGLEMIENHPVSGIGLGNFTALSAMAGVEGKQGMACNTFLEIAAELGIPGLLAYCGIVAGALFSAGKLRKEGKRLNNLFLQYAGQALQAGLLGFASAAVFVSAEYQKPFWIITALTAAIPALIAREARKQRQTYQPLVVAKVQIAASTV